MFSSILKSIMSNSSGSSLSPSPRKPNSPQPDLPHKIGKRKRTVDEEDHENVVKKPVQRKKTKNAKPDEDEDLDLERGLNLAIGKLESRLLADYVAQRTKRFSPELSLVELEDRHIPGTSGIFISGKLRL